MPSNPQSTLDTLMRLAAIIDSRKPAAGGDPQASYVARLFHKGPDAVLKKIGEEATEVVMASKDADRGGDAAKVVAELERREGTSGIEEKTLRKVQAREREEGAPGGGAA